MSVPPAPMKKNGRRIFTYKGEVGNGMACFLIGYWIASKTFHTRSLETA